MPHHHPYYLIAYSKYLLFIINIIVLLYLVIKYNFFLKNTNRKMHFKIFISFFSFLAFFLFFFSFWTCISANTLSETVANDFLNYSIVRETTIYIFVLSIFSVFSNILIFFVMYIQKTTLLTKD